MPATPSESKPTQPQPAMQVPLLDLKPQYRPLAAEIQAAIEKVCASQGFIQSDPWLSACRQQISGG